MARCHVSTRKGLFTLERGAAGWDIARANFVGDNVTLAMHDPRSGDLIAALNHGHFGVKLHRSRDGGATWTEIAAPKYPGETRRLHAEDARRRRADGRLVAEAGVGARARRRRSARRDLVRHAAGRLVQVGGWRRFMVAQSRAVGRPAARTVVWRRRRSAGHSFDLRRPARFTTREGRRVVRRRVDDARWRQAAGR